jgi:hypothetical protein
MSITITKLDAARSQIDTAIELWFMDRDPASIHTLACAGLDVINALGAPLGELAMRYDPSRFKEWLPIVAEIRNFFKHADRNPEGTLEFKPSTNNHLLADCVDTFHRVTGSQTVTMRVFWSYFTLHNTQYFAPATVEQLPIELRSLPKQQFFEECLSVFSGVPLRN